VPQCAFYSVADGRYFPGVVALVNSLRLTGHTHEVVILDCGLTREQRDMLEREATVVLAPDGESPVLLKWRALRTHPAEVMVHLDADTIVTRSLAPLIDLADSGKVVAFADVNPHRFDGEDWSRVLGVPRLERRPYVNCGFLALPQSRIDLLEDLEEVQETMPRGWVPRPDGTLGRPFKFLDQDALNAVLASRVTAADMVVLDQRLAPSQPFKSLRLIDGGGLRCQYPDGVEPFLLHHLNAKPWLERTPPNVYSRLFRQVVTARDRALRVDPGTLPLQLRDGVGGAALRSMLSMLWVLTKARFKLRRMREYVSFMSGGPV
jgi:hypothetical protein